MMSDNVQRFLLDSRSLERGLFNPLYYRISLKLIVQSIRNDLADCPFANSMSASSNPLNQLHGLSWRSNLDHEVDGANIKPEFKRRRANYNSRFSSSKSGFGRLSTLF